jgi:hypothetical protein
MLVREGCTDQTNIQGNDVAALRVQKILTRLSVELDEILLLNFFQIFIFKAVVVTCYYHGENVLSFSVVNGKKISRLV